MANRETSDEISSLAAKVMAMPTPNVISLYANLVHDAKRLAASCLSQDQTNGKREAYKPSAGTSAYEMVAAVEQQHVEVTETLIHMIAATVLMKGIDPMNQHQVFGQPDGSYAVTFSPAEMDEMHRLYDMTATRDGMLTTVRIVPRDPAETRPPASLYAEQGRDEDEPALPQAETHAYDRPLWAARINGVLFPASDRANAEAKARAAKDDEIAQVENRFCYHDDCPAEHCNHVPDRDDEK